MTSPSVYTNRSKKTPRKGAPRTTNNPKPPVRRKARIYGRSVTPVRTSISASLTESRRTSAFAFPSLTKANVKNVFDSKGDLIKAGWFFNSKVNMNTPCRDIAKTLIGQKTVKLFGGGSTTICADDKCARVFRVRVFKHKQALELATEKEDDVRADTAMQPLVMNPIHM